MENNTARLAFTIGSVVMLGIILAFIAQGYGMFGDFDAIAYARNTRM